jgi:hypothetical protein
MSNDEEDNQNKSWAFYERRGEQTKFIFITGTGADNICYTL